MVFAFFGGASSFPTEPFSFGFEVVFVTNRNGDFGVFEMEIQSVFLICTWSSPSDNRSVFTATTENVFLVLQIFTRFDIAKVESFLY